MSSLDYLDLCRLCLVKDRVSVPIFEDEGDVRQIFLKITACLPVKVGRDDKLPKKICDDCVYKVELFYQFWNTTANAEKQLLQWLGEVGGLEEKQGYVTDILNQNVMKQERNSENRLEGSLMQVSGHPNNMDINMMDENMTLSIPMMIPTGNQQISVPMDSVGNTVQAVPGPSTQASLDQVSQSQVAVSSRQDEEDETSDEDDNTDDDCDNEGLPVKEESEDDPNSSRNLEPATFVNVSLCDEAGPSGLQQQKISEMSEIAIPQTSDGDPKTELPQESGLFIYGSQSMSVKPWDIVNFEGNLYYAFLPSTHLPISVKYKGSGDQDQKREEDKDQNPTHNTSAKVFINNEYLPIIHDKFLNNNKVENLSKIYNDNINEKSMESDYLRVEKVLEFETSANTFLCSECNNLFSTFHLLQKHLCIVHNQAQFYKCQMCNKKYTSFKKFTIHKNEEHSIGNCTGIYTESVNTIYRCTKCTYVSTNKSTLQSHISRKHSKVHCNNIFSQEYSCYICDVKCHNKRRLKEHVERKHVLDYKYECEYCGKKFKVKGDMRLHIRFKHKEDPIVCDVCGKTCSNSNSLYVHQKWAHFKPKFECEICKRRMVTQENLDQHILLQHERRESFVCAECGKSFSENHRLKQHMMTHTGDRPHDCHICGKAFARRTAFRQHMLIHTGQRPYMCDICGKSFTQKPGLICHRKSHPGVHPPLPVVHIDSILSDFMKKV